MENKRYRPNVACIVLSSSYPLKCEFLVARRSDMKDVWQFPQGGIDKKEEPKEALLRELKEEIGTNKIDILCEYPKWVSYDFPSTVAKKMYPFDGQVQKYFLARLKPDARVDIKTKNPEFDLFEFVNYDELFKRVNHFKRPVYRQVLNYFKQEGFI